MDKRHLACSKGDLEIVRSEQFHLVDAKGKRYIDFTSGWCVANLGWTHPPVQEAIRNFAGPTYVYPGYTYGPWAELAQKLTAMAPGGLEKCFRATGGTEAVEIALQAAMVHTGRRKFLSVSEAYHGNSIATGSIGEYSREDFPNLLSGCHKISPPLNEAALARVETQLKHRDVAAFIIEPVLCNLGVLIPEDAFFRGLQRVCRRYGTLLIIDEVATGFGRTGKMFGCELFGLEPDILCLAKAITGGFAAMGATLTTTAVAKSAVKASEYYSTYGWHPLSTAAALANIDFLLAEKNNLLAKVESIGSLFDEHLAGTFPKCELRRKGLAIGLDLRNEKMASQLKKKAEAGGLLITNDGKTITLFPSLNIDRDVAVAGLGVLAAGAASLY